MRLAIAADPAVERANAIAEAIFLARDLINTPAADLGPAELAEAAERWRHALAPRVASWVRTCCSRTSRPFTPSDRPAPGRRG